MKKINILVALVLSITLLPWSVAHASDKTNYYVETEYEYQAEDGSISTYFFGEDGNTYTYSEDKTVLGANITGNVYGGGNEAEVTGDTNVNIGKKSE